MKVALIAFLALINFAIAYGQVLPDPKTLKNAEAGNAAAQFEVAKSYYAVEDYNKAALWLQRSAGQGNAAAQSMLGSVYMQGRGLAKDNKEALKWFTLAAEQGNITAQHNLGMLYTLEGTQDYALARHWLSQAQQQGYTYSEYPLANLYYNGQGGAVDYPRAMGLYLKVAARNERVAQFQLAYMYYAGQGVAKDDSKAIEYYTKAASQNLHIAMLELGNLLIEKNNPVLGCAWIYLSGDSKMADYCRQSLSTAEQELAQKRMSEIRAAVEPRHGSY